MGSEMRLDKYLKVSRLVKRRTLAKELCDQGRVEINGKVAKAGSVVKRGDQLVIRFGQKLLRVRVEHVQENVRKEEADKLYTLLEEVRLEHELEN
jgi:ribosomal 50S subunit-recycling heat shock protein